MRSRVEIAYKNISKMEYLFEYRGTSSKAKYGNIRNSE